MKSRRAASVLVLLVGIGCTATIDFTELQDGCPADLKACDETCVERDNPNFGCAAESCEPCDITHGTATCAANGACTARTCQKGFKVCDGVCVSTSNPLYGCGRVRCDPCILPDATASCDIDGECAVGACIGRRGDCNRDAEDGCEANLNEDVDNCGQCGELCPPMPHAEVTCGGANCVVRLCDRGWGNCDEVQNNGCETNLLTTHAHCGSCGEPCAPGEVCEDGRCV